MPKLNHINLEKIFNTFLLLKPFVFSKMVEFQEMWQILHEKRKEKWKH